MMEAGNVMPVINDGMNFVKHFSSDQNCTFSTDEDVLDEEQRK